MSAPRRSLRRLRLGWERPVGEVLREDAAPGEISQGDQSARSVREISPRRGQWGVGREMGGAATTRVHWKTGLNGCKTRLYKLTTAFRHGCRERARRARRRRRVPVGLRPLTTAAAARAAVSIVSSSFSALPRCRFKSGLVVERSGCAIPASAPWAQLQRTALHAVCLRSPLPNFICAMACAAWFGTPLVWSA